MVERWSSNCSDPRGSNLGAPVAPSSTRLGWGSWSGFRASSVDEGSGPNDDECDPKFIFWNLLTHRLTARNSRSGWYGPSPLESLPILYLLSSSCSSNDEFLVHPSVIRVIGRSSRSQKLQVVFLSSFLNLIQSFRLVPLNWSWLKCFFLSSEKFE